VRVQYYVPHLSFSALCNILAFSSAFCFQVLGSTCDVLDRLQVTFGCGPSLMRTDGLLSRPGPHLEAGDEQVGSINLTNPLCTRVSLTVATYRLTACL
jgi:hypothetical protein